MSTTVDDIDDLEAMLLGLEADETAKNTAIAPTDDADDIAAAALAELEAKESALAEAAAEAAAAEEVIKPAAKPRARRLKPLNTDTDEAPAEPAPEAPVPDEPSSELQGTRTETADSDLEALALQVIDLLTVIGTEHPDLTDELIYTTAKPVLDRIKATSSLAKVEAAIRKRIDAIPKPEPVPGNDGPSDEELAGLLDEPVPTPELKPEPESAPASSDEPTDEELEALLSAPSVEVSKPVIPVPTAASAPAIATRPTKTVAKAALNTFIDADVLKKDLEFTDATIGLAMTRQAALFAHYSRLAADAQYQADRMKQQVELTEAILNQRFRDSLIASGTKPTEKTIDTMVIQDTGYQDALERMHEAKAIAKMVDTAADSFRHRKDMLQGRGADLRLEKQGELRMKEHPGEAAKRAIIGE